MAHDRAFPPPDSFALFFQGTKKNCERILSDASAVFSNPPPPFPSRTYLLMTSRSGFPSLVDVPTQSFSCLPGKTPTLQRIAFSSLPPGAMKEKRSLPRPRLLGCSPKDLPLLPPPSPQTNNDRNQSDPLSFIAISRVSETSKNIQLQLPIPPSSSPPCV